MLSHGVAFIHFDYLTLYIIIPLSRLPYEVKKSRFPVALQKREVKILISKYPSKSESAAVFGTSSLKKIFILSARFKLSGVGRRHPSVNV